MIKLTAQFEKAKQRQEERLEKVRKSGLRIEPDGKEKVRISYSDPSSMEPGVLSKIRADRAARRRILTGRDKQKQAGLQ